MSGEVRIAYEVHAGAVAGAPWAILVHGLGYGRWGWEPVVAPLAERFRLLLLDNRGIGSSDVPEGPYTAAAMAVDVLAVLDHAGAGEAHVIGTSLGGMIAQEVAIARPDRVRGLVLVSTTPGGEDAFPIPEGTVRLIAEMPRLPPEVALGRAVVNALGPATLAVRPDLVDRILARRLANPPHPLGWQAQAVAGTTHAAGPGLAGIRAPTLVVHGTADAVVDPRNAALLVARIPGARLALFDGAGHLLMWEEPDRMVEVVTDFLTSIDRPAPSRPASPP